LKNKEKKHTTKPFFGLILVFLTKNKPKFCIFGEIFKKLRFFWRFAEFFSRLFGPF